MGSREMNSEMVVVVDGPSLTVTPLVTGGSPDREARGQSFMYYLRNPRNINLFVRIPDREDR